MSRSTGSLTEFRLLFREDEFVDYFNKFTCLPAFTQLVVYSKKLKTFLLEPNLPKNSYVLNRNGLIEWLWRKHLKLFVKSRLYHEYRLSVQLIKHDLVRSDCNNIKLSELKTIKESLRWLQKRCFGKVSSMRRFRIFLQKSGIGYKFYQFWMDTEILYQHIKKRSSSCMELFNAIKEKYFTRSGELAVPQHLLDAAWDNLPGEQKTANKDRKNYNVTFTLCFQKLCLQRLKAFWVPRYLISVKIKTSNEEEKAYYDLALGYLQGNIPDSFIKEKESMDSDKEFDSSSDDYDVLVTPEIDLTQPGGKKGKILDAAGTDPRGVKKKKSWMKPRKPKVSFAMHAPPGESSSDEGSERKNLKVKRFLQRSKYRRLQKAKVRKQRSGSADAANLSQHHQAMYEANNSDDEYEDMDESESEESGDEEEEEDSRREGSDGGSESSESWEGVHDKFRKRKGDKKFIFQERHRSRSISARKQKFEQLLQTATNRRTSVAYDQPNKQIKTKGKRKTEQTILDNVTEDDIELGGSWESMAMKQQQTQGRRGTGFVKLESPLDMENIGGKALLKAALRLPTPTSENEGFLGTTDSFWDLPPDTSPSPDLRRNSDVSASDKLGGSSSSRMMLTKLPGRRMSRRGSQESVGSTATVATAVMPKKRRQSVATPLKKTKVTTLTFSLSGDGPTENSRQVQKEEKPKKKETKRMSVSFRAKRKLLPKAVDKLPSIAQKNPRIFSMEKDNAYRSKPENMRVIMAFQSDHLASNPFQQFLINTDNSEMVHYLRFWQDVEVARWDYQFGSMTFAVFLNSLHSVVTQYLLPNSPYRIESPESLRKSVIAEVMSPETKEMPWQLHKLQMEVLEDLKCCYETYCQQEIQSFLNAATFRIDDANPEYTNSFGGFSNHIYPRNRQVVPVSAPLAPRLPSLPLLNDAENSDAEMLRSEMNRRMLRAQKLFSETNLPKNRTYKAPSDDDTSDSDEDGRVHSPKPPTVVIKPKPDMKLLASQSIRQYPDPNNTITLLRSVKAVERHQNAASFYKPIKRAGHFIRRPLTRPANFREVLFETTHLEFFKRYLKSYRSDQPLLFWVAVEALRNTDNMKERQNKAKVIIRRYFHNTKLQAVKLLQCNADIIREIPYLDVVTTSMLFSAQNVIGKVLEHRWFHKYSETFADSIFSNPVHDEPSVCDKTTKLKRGHLKRAWVIFNGFIKRAAMFMLHMKEDRFFNMFHNFLEREVDREDVVRPVYDSMQSDIVAKRSNMMPFIDLSRNDEPEKEKKNMKQRIINGQLVTFNLLPNDLRFWREIQCYKSLADCSSAMKSIGKEREEDNKLLKKKAKLIIQCYLDSSIIPTVRVNVPQEVAEITCESLQNDLIDRGLFHEATIYVFPLLLVFWKKFCDEFYKYSPVLSKKYRRIYGLKMTPVIAALLKEKKKAEDKRPLKVKKSSRISTADFPNYLHMDPSKFKKRRGSPHGDDVGPRLTFSVSKGVTLIEPMRRRKCTVMNTASPDIRVLPTLPSTASSRRRSVSSRVDSPKKLGARAGGRRAGMIDVALLEKFASLQT